MDDRAVFRSCLFAGIAAALGVAACGSDSPAPTGPSAAGSSGSGAGASGGSGGTAGEPAGGSGGVGGTGGTGGSATGGTSAGGGGTGGAGGSSGAACTRDGLKALVDQYFEALSAHTAASLPLASNVKYTENGAALEIGAGLHGTAGALKFKHSAFDTETCSSVTEAVVADGNTDIPYGLRLKVVEQKIAEIESIAVRSGDYFVASNTGAIIASESEAWEAPVAADQRATREELAGIVDVYFKRFPAGGCGFASDCKRLENGFSPGACTLGLSCSTSGSGSMGMTPRLLLVDVEAGIGVGFVMFLGGHTDFHMFKVRGGEVHGVHAILAEASSAGW